MTTWPLCSDSITYMNRRLAVRAVILHEETLLCVRLKPSDAAQNNGSFWCVPGGGLELGESIEEGLQRELIEELGVRPEIGNLMYVQQYKDEQSEYLEFIFSVTNTEDYLNIDLTKTTHGMVELQEIAFLDPKAVHLLPKFLTERQLSVDMAARNTNFFNYL